MINRIVESLPKNISKPYRNRSLNQIEEITIHHSASDSSTIGRMADYHISKGWGGIGYHYVIDKSGDIHQTNYLTTLSYHSGGRNTKAIGICLIGDYSTKEPPFEQLKSLDYLVNHLRSALIIKDVKAHNETKATICPGEYLTKFVKDNYK